MSNNHELYSRPRPLAYIDTLGVRSLNRPLELSERNRLEKTCRSLQRIYPRSLAYPSRGYKYTFQLPTNATFHILANLRLDVEICELHVALDYPKTTDGQAYKHWLWFALHLVKPYKRTDTVGWCENTRYAETRRWGRNNDALYEQHEDRHNKKPCVHYEIRITGAGAVRRIGINGPADLLTFDLRAFFQRRLCLKMIDFAALGEMFPDRRYRTNAESVKIGKRIAIRARILAGDRCDSAQAVECYLRGQLEGFERATKKRMIDRVLRPIDNSPFLPRNRFLLERAQSTVYYDDINGGNNARGENAALAIKNETVE